MIPLQDEKPSSNHPSPASGTDKDDVDDHASAPAKQDDDIGSDGDGDAGGASDNDNEDHAELEEGEDDSDEEEKQDGGTEPVVDAHDVAMGPPDPKFRTLDRVLARDTDGLLYQAVIRRSLYGPHTHKQVQVGMVSSQKELDECMKEIEDEEEAHQPIWHYFVHYLKWKVNWDRWVSETDVLAMTPETEAFAIKILAEHKSLQREFKSGLTGRKKGGAGIALPTLDGGTFLLAWKIKLKQLYQEETELQARRDDERREKERQEEILAASSQTQDSSSEAVAKQGGDDRDEDGDDGDDARKKDGRRSSRAKPVPTTWSAEDAASAQKQARQEDDERKKLQEAKDKAAAAKKKAAANNGTTTSGGWPKPVLQKEQRLRQRDLSCIFGTTNTKTGATANDAMNVLLNKYKISFPFSLKKTLVEEWEIISTCHMVANVPAQIPIRQALLQYLASKLPSDGTATTSTTKTIEPNSKDVDDQDKGEDSMDVEAEEQKDKIKDGREKDWTDMVEGISLFFDQALPFRLLYHQEIPQYTVLMKQQQQDIKLHTQKEKEARSQSKVSKESGTSVKQETVEESKSLDSHLEDATTPSTGATPIVTLSGTIDTTTSSISAGDSSLATATLSDLYGCEHLLRLFLRLPALLAEDQLEQRQRRQKRKAARAAAQKEKAKFTSNDLEKVVDNEENDNDDEDEEDAELQQRNIVIIARVNDLVRFLHKHQSTLFAQSYRKWTNTEQREHGKLHKRATAKRKRTSGEGTSVGVGGPSPTVSSSTLSAVTTTAGGGGPPPRKRKR
jgi:hypothetical protein